MELVADGWNDYALIDSGNGLRLERVGSVVMTRQSAQAIWPTALSEAEWKAMMHVSHFRHDQGPGSWTEHKAVPNTWRVAYKFMNLGMKLRPFGHVGMFAEQQVQWDWILSHMQTWPGERLLNLFAYTGASTLAALAAGARATHVDAVRASVSWAGDNAKNSGLGDSPSRWIVEDAVKYVERELKRDSRYEALIIDPPTFGRGPRGRVWKIEKELSAFMERCRMLLSDNARFVLLSAHTPGVTAATLKNMLAPLVNERGGKLSAGDMVQKATQSPMLLPAGVFCRWSAFS
jgi:23S rRNA (cytosine1962-C5)-methyltransferase